ncbi:MAG: hypothetical protein KDC44_05910 [Phaeodactylibacter sp.]|nr:hypothetical protein [Phaeodactylibacter sp.]
MENFFLYRQLKRLEREANDDLRLVLEAGPEYYTNEELYGLLNDLEHKRINLLKIRSALLVLAGGMLLWAALSVFAQYQEITWLAWLSFSFFIIDFSAFLAGSWFFTRKFRLMRRGIAIRNTIVAELERRRKDASIF